MNPDFRELLQAFNDHGVEYMVVGAHALAAHGHVRATKDLDVWVRPDRENASRILAAITSFGAPTAGLDADDLSTKGTIFQVGVPPIRIDIITSIDGVDFAAAWTARMQTLFAGVPTAVISKRDLIVNKKAAGRLQDLADVEVLESQES